MDKTKLAGRLWCDQIEDCSEEEDSHADDEGDNIEEEFSDDQRVEVEEQSVNGKNANKQLSLDNVEPMKQVGEEDAPKDSQEINPINLKDKPNIGDMQEGEGNSRFATVNPNPHPKVQKVLEIDKGGTMEQ